MLFYHYSIIPQAQKIVNSIKVRQLKRHNYDADCFFKNNLGISAINQLSFFYLCGIIGWWMVLLCKTIEILNISYIKKTSKTTVYHDQHSNLDTSCDFQLYLRSDGNRNLKCFIYLNTYSLIYIECLPCASWHIRY